MEQRLNTLAWINWGEHACQRQHYDELFSVLMDMDWSCYLHANRVNQRG